MLQNGHSCDAFTIQLYKGVGLSKFIFGPLLEHFTEGTEGYSEAANLYVRRTSY